MVLAGIFSALFGTGWRHFSTLGWPMPILSRSESFEACGVTLWGVRTGSPSSARRSLHDVIDHDDLTVLLGIKRVKARQEWSHRPAGVRNPEASPDN